GWGVVAAGYGLHSRRPAGVGDLTDLDSLSAWTTGLGGRVTGTLPLLSNFMEQPYDPSPYAPASRIFWNEFYIDPLRAPEFANSAKAQKLAAENSSGLARLVYYAATMPAKRRLIDALARTFFS